MPGNQANGPSEGGQSKQYGHPHHMKLGKLTIMMLVEFGRYKMMQNHIKITETLPNGYSSEGTQLELSNEYQHDRV